MKNTVSFFAVLIHLTLNAQVNSDSIFSKNGNIEAIVFDDRDYEKIDYSFALKKEINSGLKSVNPNIGFEMGMIFRNTLNKKGVINGVTLFLYKTDAKDKVSDLEINFYNIDSLTGKPGTKINKSAIIYSPKNKRKGNVRIPLANHKIIFPVKGVFVAVKWLPTKDFDKKTGPALRLTNFNERLTYTRFDNGKWGYGPNFCHKNNCYTNIMVGIDVLVKRKKKHE
ncbi:hypothetical protein [Pedobacter sp. KLB.chiD]|uniref:hypothetical protein n=1 Tax=Pedobacter sp. KLB.chiD TaxID=3387402 RepID=UPI00399AB827